MNLPPRWAGGLLRTMMRARDQETIPGDLLEEYREEVLPQRGKFQADVWYLRQVLSFVGVASLARLRVALVADRVVWAVAVATIQYLLWFVLPGRTGKPAEQLSVTFVGLIIACFAGSAVRSGRDALRLFAACLLWLLPFAATAWMAMRTAEFSPVGAVAMFILLVPMSAFFTARSSGSLRRGVLTAVLTGSVMFATLVAMTEANGRPHPPIDAFPTPPVVAAIVGLAGASFGKRFRRMGGDFSKHFVLDV